MSAFLLGLLAAGFMGGLLAGLLGIGGGIFFLLVLPEALKSLGVADVDLAATVIANSLVGTLVSAISASLAHFRQKTPGQQDILWLGIAAAIAAYLSLFFLVSNPLFNERVFNGIVVLVLGALLARTLHTFLKEGKENSSSSAHTFSGNPSTYKLTVTGSIAGLVSSLTGLGGGVLIVPMLREWAAYPLRRASFVSSGAIVISSLAALYFSLSSKPHVQMVGFWGYICPQVAVPLVAGVVFAAPLGVKLATRISSRKLTLIYMAFVTLVLLRRATGLF